MGRLNDNENNLFILSCVSLTRTEFHGAAVKLSHVSVWCKLEVFCFEMYLINYNYEIAFLLNKKPEKSFFFCFLHHVTLVSLSVVAHLQENQTAEEEEAGVDVCCCRTWTGCSSHFPAVVTCSRQSQSESTLDHHRQHRATCLSRCLCVDGGPLRFYRRHRLAVSSAEGGLMFLRLFLSLSPALSLSLHLASIYRPAFF